MKLRIAKNKLNISPDMLLKRAGYAFFRDRNTGKESYSRRLGNDFYPKFHMYVEDYRDEGVDKLLFSLHLDQKHASYEGASHMHNADYEGPVVEEEINRLKRVIVEHVKKATEENNSKVEKKKSWWKFF